MEVKDTFVWETLCIDGKQYIKLFYISSDIAAFTPHDLNVRILQEKKEDSFVLTFEEDIYYNLTKKRIAKQLEVSSALKELNAPWILKPDIRSELCKMLCGGIKKQKLKLVKDETSKTLNKKNTEIIKSKNEKKKNKHEDSEEEEEEEECAEEDELEEDEDELEEEEGDDDIEHEEEDVIVLELENQEEEEDIDEEEEEE
jgi:hypothetical protein